MPGNGGVDTLRSQNVNRLAFDPDMMRGTAAVIVRPGGIIQAFGGSEQIVTGKVLKLPTRDPGEGVVLRALYVQGKLSFAFVATNPDAGKEKLELALRPFPCIKTAAASRPISGFFLDGERPADHVRLVCAYEGRSLNVESMGMLRISAIAVDHQRGRLYGAGPLHGRGVKLFRVDPVSGEACDHLRLGMSTGASLASLAVHSGRLVVLSRDMVGGDYLMLQHDGPTGYDNIMSDAGLESVCYDRDGVLYGVTNTAIVEVSLPRHRLITVVMIPSGFCFRGVTRSGSGEKVFAFVTPDGTHCLFLNAEKRSY